jgi:hypothetical protein
MQYLGVVVCCGDISITGKIDQLSTTSGSKWCWVEMEINKKMVREGIALATEP